MSLEGPLEYPLGGEPEPLSSEGRGFSYWGPHFPDEKTGFYWGGHFPRPSTLAVPANPATDGPLVSLSLESGATVTYSWRTGLFKSYSGKESRSNFITRPAERYRGACHIKGANVLAERARLQRQAHLGSTFLLSMPFEEVTVIGAAIGMVVPVTGTSQLDWACPGQRVVVEADGTDGDLQQWAGVIQDVGANTLTIDDGTGAGPGQLARPGARVIPLMTVLMDPQQSFGRYSGEDGVERWDVSARAAQFGFAGATELAAYLTLADVTSGANLRGAELYALVTGPDGNGIAVTFSADAEDDSGDIIEDTEARTVHIKFSTGTTIERLVQLIAMSTLIGIRGSLDGDAVMVPVDDEFTAEVLANGRDAFSSDPGKSAALTEYMDAPVWDHGIDVAGTAADSLQSMNELIDLGGVPAGVGSASTPDWGRAVNITRTSIEEWQWLKLFLSTVRGRWASWWLPSYRKDFEVVSHTDTTITVSKAIGDVLAWYPQRTHLAVFGTESTTYVAITDIADAGDNWLLTLSGEIPEPDMVSWLDLVRFESDEIDIGWSGATFSMATTARVVQPSIDEVEIREGIEIELPAVTYRIATGDQDVTIAGRTFKAAPGGRGETGIYHIDGSTDDAEIRLPVSHAVSQRFLQQGWPPVQAVCKVYRSHPSGDEVVWQGNVSSIAPERYIAKLRVTSQTIDIAQRRAPPLTFGRLCPHVLYDSLCRVDRANQRGDGTVATINGNVVRVLIDAVDDGNATFGDFVHVSSGESRIIGQQAVETSGPNTYAVCTLQAPIAGMAIGDAVEIYAGCDHSITTCRDKFNNVINFGGFPEKPKRSIWDPKSMGFSSVP